MRRQVLSIAAAVYGFACGIALMPVWIRPARPGQLPGLMTSLGLDAHASYRFYLGVVALTLIAPLLARPLVARMEGAQRPPSGAPHPPSAPSPHARAEGHVERWAFVAMTSALSFALWIAAAEETLFWVAIPPLIVAIACFLLRNVPRRFTRGDVMLIPAFLCVFMAVSDLAATLTFGKRVIVAALLVFAVRLAVRCGHAFALTSIALLLQSHFNGYDARHNGWFPLLIVLLPPFALQFVRDTRRMRQLIAYVVYPIVILSYASATSMLAAEGKPHGDLFEDSHNLTTASEMLRGEKPYRDIIPSHGLIQDGLLDYVILRTGRQTAGRVIQAHGVIGTSISIAGYAVAACATGSADLGLLAYFLARGMDTVGGAVRGTPALFALALITYGVRRRNARAFAWAGAMLVLAALTSLDFAFYSGICLLVALAMRRFAWRHAAIGVGISGAVVLLAMTIAGITTSFLRTTLFEVPGWSAVYAMTPFAAPDALRAHRFPPDVLLAIFDHASFSTLFFALCLIGLAAGFHTMRRRRGDVLIVLAVWVVTAGISYAERHHPYPQFIAAPLAIALVTFMRNRAWLIAGLVILAQPTTHLLVVDMLRHTHGPMSADVTEVPEIPRARGAFYSSHNAAIMRSVQAYVATKLRPDETFFDFTNRGALYFLLDRDCPIRQVEPAFYETDEQQRDVIASIEANPKIMAVLVPRDGDATATVDNVPNQTRAPLVWQYLQQHFRPDFEEGDVVIWRRVTTPSS